MELNTIKEFNNHKGEVTCKYINYFEVYDHIFLKILEKKANTRIPIHLVELGILKGGSLQIWKKLLRNSIISGVDLKKSIKDASINCYKGSQTDEKLFEVMRNNNGLIDILIDDASHIARFSIISLLNFIKNCNDYHGYICEDLNTHFDMDREGSNILDTLRFTLTIKNLALQCTDKNFSIILSNQIFGYLGKNNFELINLINSNKKIDTNYLKNIDFTNYFKLFNKLIEENKTKNKLVIEDFNQYESPGDLIVFCYLLSQRITIEKLSPDFISVDFLKKISSIPAYIKSTIIEDNKIVINFINEVSYFKAKNYGSRTKLFLFECEGRIKNNFIKILKHLKYK